MPWKVVPKGEKFAVVKKGDGSVVAMHPTNAAAQAQVRAMYANYNGNAGGSVRKDKSAKASRLAKAAGRRNSRNSKGSSGIKDSAANVSSKKEDVNQGY